MDGRRESVSAPGKVPPYFFPPQLSPPFPPFFPRVGDPRGGRSQVTWAGVLSDVWE